MNKSIHILYIGNDLAKKSKYHSAYATLKNNLKEEGYKVTTASGQKNLILRLVHMLFKTLLYGGRVDYVLIDTFSTTAFYYAFLVSQLSRLLNLKYIPILHGGDLPKRLNESPKMSNLIFRNAFLNISPSNYLKTAFEKSGFEVSLIANTIDINDFNFLERKAVQPKLLYVRAFADIYNPILAVEVLHKLLETHPKAELCMVGPDRDGSLAIVKQKITELSLEEKVRITGVLPKEEWYKLSVDYDIFINTTNVDNTPVSLIEAMGLGLPIVSTNVGGIPYLMEDDEDATLVEPNNVKAMNQAILDLLEDPNKAKKYSTQGRVKAETMDWGVVKKQWNKVLV